MLTVRQSLGVGLAFVLGTLIFCLVEGWARGMWKPSNFLYQASAWATFVAQFMILVAIVALILARLVSALARRLAFQLSRSQYTILVAASLGLLGLALAWHYLFVFPLSYAASVALAAAMAGRAQAAA